MKYVVLQVTDSPLTGKQEDDLVREIPFVFPNSCVHAEVAEWMAHMLLSERPKGQQRIIKPISAGFISSTVFIQKHADPACHGKSESLKLKSRLKEDDKLLGMHDYLHGLK